MPLLSDFAGANENPLSEGGNWANVNSSGNVLQLISNAVACTVAGGGVFYWTPVSTMGPDLDMYVTISTLGGAGVVARVKDEGGSFTWDGYRVDMIAGGTSCEIARVDNSTATILNTIPFTWGAGDKIGARFSGPVIQLWRQASGSSTWTQLGQAIDSTYPAAGRIGIYAVGTTVRVDEFFAGVNDWPFGVPSVGPTFGR